MFVWFAISSSKKDAFQSEVFVTFVSTAMQSEVVYCCKVEVV